MKALAVVCETTELAVDCKRRNESLITIVPAGSDADWLHESKLALRAHRHLGVLLMTPPPLEALVTLAEQSESKRANIVIAVVENNVDSRRALAAVTDLGIYAANDVADLVIALELISSSVAGDCRPYFDTRDLSLTDRARLNLFTTTPVDASLLGLASMSDGNIGLRVAPGNTDLHALGPVEAVRAAIGCIGSRNPTPRRVLATVEEVDRDTVLDTLFGPRRALSDPASKAALGPYGLPLPPEELCTSPSRVAVEAARIGYPVRISLTSPDLRVWNHPELAIDMVGSAAQAREAFRNLTMLGTKSNAITPTSRVLGVTVMASSVPTVSLWIIARPLPADRVHVELGFADPHGLATRDATTVILPTDRDQLTRGLRRLGGRDLLLPNNKKHQDIQLDALTEVLLRLSAFLTDYRSEVESVELRPVCILMDGSAEVREVCIQVSDYFERSMKRGAS